MYSLTSVPTWDRICFPPLSLFCSACFHRPPAAFFSDKVDWMTTTTWVLLLTIKIETSNHSPLWGGWHKFISCGCVSNTLWRSSCLFKGWDGHSGAVECVRRWESQESSRLGACTLEADDSVRAWPYQPCKLGQVTSPLWASLSSYSEVGMVAVSEDCLEG